MAYRLTDYGENRFADFIRGVSLPVSGSWYFGLLSAAGENSFTELSGASYARKGITASLVNFAGTQGATTVLASTGVSHTTSNNVPITFGTAGVGGWGTVNFIGLFDALSGGQCWMYIPVTVPLSITAGTVYTIQIGEFSFSLGLSGGMTNYLSNKLIDYFIRGQVYNYPVTAYVALFTSMPSNSGGGVEATGSSYARAAIASSTTAWSSTQSVGGTSTSNGSAGRISNNAAIAFPNPPLGENWGTVLGAGIIDASTAGNLLFWGPFVDGPQTLIGGTTAPGFNPDTLGITFD